MYMKVVRVIIVLSILFSGGFSFSVKAESKNTIVSTPQDYIRYLAELGKTKPEALKAKKQYEE